MTTDTRIAGALTPDEQAFWDRAFCAALTGLLAWQQWSITTEAVNDAVETADIALAARQRKEST